MKYLLPAMVVLIFALLHGLSQLTLASEVNGESIAIALKVSVIGNKRIIHRSLGNSPPYRLRE